jgi:hypothetical protein
MKNLLKDKEEYEKLTKTEVIAHIRAYLIELADVSERSRLDKENFEKASWPYLQAYECGVQKTIHKLQEFINI